MRNPNYRVTLLLMTSSMLLLLVLQGLWLRSEYRGASGAFKRETNLLFRSTVQHLADSVIVSQLRTVSGMDTISLEHLPLFRRGGMGNATAPIHIQSVDVKKDTTEAKRYSNRTFTIRMEGNEKDSISHVNFSDTLGANRRFTLNMFARAFDADTLHKHYQTALSPRFSDLDVTILEKQVDWFQHGWSRQQERNDSLPFATSFLPMGMNTVYAANFTGVRGFLLKGLLPQIGFSIFITGLILFSFILVYRSLLSQQRLIEQRNNFIGNVTHELKTPVATVGVALEAMKSFDVLRDPIKTNEYIDMAIHELERLAMMTDKILKTSVFDYETEIRKNKSAVDMVAVVQKVLSSFKLLAQKTQIQLTFEHHGSCIFSGHEEHLTQMVYNLVDNAFKYASEGPNIHIHVEELPGQVLLKVIDQGPGIAEAHHQKIFEKFYRIPAGNTHNVKGHGLGLNYVEGVVRSHGGKIALVSRQAQGATFEVKLPKNG